MDADRLHGIVCLYALETLADAIAVLVIDATGFLTQCHTACIVARQYTCSAGKIINCQICVFASYVFHHGHALIDRALYLHKVEPDDPGRLEKVHAPEAVDFTTIPTLGAPQSGAPWRRYFTLMGGSRQRLRGGDTEIILRCIWKGYVLYANSKYSRMF